MSEKIEYRYVFTNGDVVELRITRCGAQEEEKNEISAEWIETLLDFDRMEYNNNHKESRRHCSLEAYNQDETLLPTEKDGFKEFYAREVWKEMSKELTDREIVIGDLYFIQGYSQHEIAKVFWINRSRVTQIITRIRKKLKKFL